MTTRRDFLETGYLSTFGMTLGMSLYGSQTSASREITKKYTDLGAVLVSDSIDKAQKGKKKNVPPVLREEILDNPNAVFLVETPVESRRLEDGRFPAENEQMERAGYETAQKIFKKGNSRGGLTYIKPNFVGGFSDREPDLNNGISTHPSFVAGFSDTLREMGNRNIIVQANGATSHKSFVESGICEIMHDHKIIFVEGKYQNFEKYIPGEITWADCPEGVVMKKIPFFKPAMDEDTTFINMAKDRCHNLGFTTLCIKNLQGIMPVGYMHICQTWAQMQSAISSSISPEAFEDVFNPDYQREIERLYVKHALEGYKHWDTERLAHNYFTNGGWEAYKNGEFKVGGHIFWSEQWGQRMIDINSCITPYVNMVEGIFGVDMEGKIHLNNFITISRSIVSCDALAAWLMGHDPRELHFLRIANDRGLGENDIEKLTIYKITENDVIRVKDYRELKSARMGVYIYGNKDYGLTFF